MSNPLERIDAALRLAHHGLDSHGYRMRRKDISAHIDKLLDQRIDILRGAMPEDHEISIGERLDADTIAALKAKVADAQD
ncbi:hypothetical protein G4X40_19835 [Rhodococcus sp. D2-41]|uniref:hypothetical protein n=1 Tax=Speluncibacter jeojiensis TaxID=2710754 RepID=UPI00240F4425|nr:hypothetical protein [Rhodococcus sp. D2-41]MDG3012395.1 hypothetical protein [Rhodococcus sp. D2-41]